MNSSGLTIAEIAEIVDGQVIGEKHDRVVRTASLDKATHSEVSFLSNPAFAQELDTTNAGCVLLSAAYEKSHWDVIALQKNKPTNWVLCSDPYLAFARISQALDTSPLLNENINQNASIHPSVTLGENVQIGAGVVVCENSHIADNVSLGCNSFVGPNSSIDKGTILFPNVTIYHGIKIGKNCLLHSGVVIGSDGFGYANDQGVWVKIPQTGGVNIGNNVEIGANSCVDRGALNNTIISDGVKIDNLCHIAHNVEIGENTAMAAYSGVAGSTKLGRSCTLSGRSSIIGHLNIADGTHITACTLVNRSNDEPGIFSSGTGMQENKVWRKNVARFKQLDSMAKKLRELEKKLKKIQGE